MPDELASEAVTPRKLQAHLLKQPDLRGIERVTGSFGAGEVAHQQRDAVVFGLHARGKGRSLVGRHAKPVHAGIDVERRATAPVTLGDERIPLRKLRRAVDHRPCGKLDKGRAGIGVKPLRT